VSQRAIKHGYRDCPIKAINAGHIDDLVRALSLDYLASVSVDQLASQPPEARDHWIRHVIDVVVLTTESLVIRLDAFKVGQCHEIPRSHDPAPQKPAPTCPFRPEIQNHGRQIVMTLAIQIKRLDGRRILLSPDGRDLILPVNLNRARTSSTPLASRTVGMKRYSPRAARSASLLGRKRSAKVRFANFCR
jgi:hypothetical protein